MKSALLVLVQQVRARFVIFGHHYNTAGWARGAIFWPLMALAVVLLYRGQLPSLPNTDNLGLWQTDIGVEVETTPELPLNTNSDMDVTTKSLAATETAQPAQPAQPTQPVQPTQPTQPTQPASSAKADVSATGASAATISFSPEKSVRPVSGALLRSQGWQRHPLYGDWRLMSGVDLQAAPGEAIKAAYSGTVASIAKDAQNTWQVSLTHAAGWTSEYYGLAVVTVTPEQKVIAGESLGKTGLAGESTVTFVLRNNDKLVDPALYLKE